MSIFSNVANRALAAFGAIAITIGMLAISLPTNPQIQSLTGVIA